MRAENHKSWQDHRDYVEALRFERNIVKFVAN